MHWFNKAGDSSLISWNNNNDDDNNNINENNNNTYLNNQHLTSSVIFCEKLFILLTNTSSMYNKYNTLKDCCFLTH